MQARIAQLLRVIGVCALSCTLLSSPATGQAMAVPLQLQAAILQKIFSYDRNLEGRRPKVLIVAADPSDVQVAEFKATLTRLGSTVTATTQAGLPAQAQGVSVVYIMPGQLTDLLSRTCTQQGILSVSGVPAWAEQGRVSVAIGFAAGKAEIIVSLKRSKAERHDLSSRLLRLARVIP